MASSPHGFNAAGAQLCLLMEKNKVSLVFNEFDKNDLFLLSDTDMQNLRDKFKIIKCMLIKFGLFQRET